jgi:hypothetical protein
VASKAAPVAVAAVQEEAVEIEIPGMENLDSQMVNVTALDLANT